MSVPRKTVRKNSNSKLPTRSALCNASKKSSRRSKSNTTCKWRPVPTLMACLLFGFLDAATARLQGVELPIIGEAPTELMLALPYILTVVLLAGFIGKAVPPKNIGEPYPKGK